MNGKRKMTAKTRLAFPPSGEFLPHPGQVSASPEGTGRKPNLPASRLRSSRGKFSGQGDDRRFLSAPRSNARHPLTEVQRLFRLHPHDGDGGLDQQPAHARVPPALVIRPFRCFSPLPNSLGTSPKYADTWCPFAKRSGLSTADANGTCCYRANLGSGTQKRHLLVGLCDTLQLRVKHANLRVERLHHCNQRRHLVLHVLRQLYRLHALLKCGRATCPGVNSLPPAESPRQADQPGPRSHEHFARSELCANVSAFIRSSMRRLVGSKPGCFCQRPRVAFVRLHLPAARCVHRREVRIRYHHLVSERLQTAGYPFTLG